MADLKALASSRATMLNFDPRLIQIQPDLNARNLSTPENREHIDGLKASIRHHGVKQPLVIFSIGDDVFVSDGHCRLTAVLELIAEGLDIKTVPCVPEARGTNDVARVLSQNIYNSGKQLTPLEQGVNFRKAMALGATIQQIAEMVGKSATFVSNMLTLQEAPAEVHTMIQTGVVSSSLAADVVVKEGPEKGLAMLKAAKVEAEKVGKTRVTGKHVQAAHAELTDWDRLRVFFVKHKVRPEHIKDELVVRMLERLGLGDGE